MGAQAAISTDNPQQQLAAQTCDDWERLDARLDSAQCAQRPLPAVHTAAGAEPAWAADRAASLKAANVHLRAHNGAAGIDMPSLLPPGVALPASTPAQGAQVRPEHKRRLQRDLERACEHSVVGMRLARVSISNFRHELTRERGSDSWQFVACWHSGKLPCLSESLHTDAWITRLHHATLQHTGSSDHQTLAYSLPPPRPTRAPTLLPVRRACCGPTLLPSRAPPA